VVYVGIYLGYSPRGPAYFLEVWQVAYDMVRPSILLDWEGFGFGSGKGNQPRKKTLPTLNMEPENGTLE